jgi:hypothetical protein
MPRLARTVIISASGIRSTREPVYPDLSAVRFQQTQDQLQNRRFPGSARPQDDLGMSGQQREADVAEHDFVVERKRDSLEDNRRALGG